MTRMWGAYGKPASSFKYGVRSPQAYGAAATAPKQEDGYGNPVHKIYRAPDGKLLVCDRLKSRVQEFELVPGGVRYIREVYVAPGSDGFGAASDVAVTPDNKFMYVSDMRTGVIWIVDRERFVVLGWVNAKPQTEGSDAGRNQRTLHRFILMPSGDILLARTGPGRLFYLKYLGVH